MSLERFEEGIEGVGGAEGFELQIREMQGTKKKKGGKVTNEECEFEGDDNDKLLFEVLSTQWESSMRDLRVRYGRVIRA